MEKRKNQAAVKKKRRLNNNFKFKNSAIFLKGKLKKTHDFL